MMATVAVVMGGFPKANLPARPQAELAVISFSPSKDNTLYEDATGSTSNGAGSNTFAGSINTGPVRRAVLAFEIAGNIPAGSTINSAAVKAGMTTMIDDGVAKCRAGITSPAEVLRVATIR